jgi:hypothetical protein
VDSGRKDRSKIPRFARNDKVVSWLLGARQPTGMSDCYENGSPPQREDGQGVVGGRVSVPGNHPWPLLNKEGIIFMHSGEPKDHEIFAQNDRLQGFFHSL